MSNLSALPLLRIFIGGVVLNYVRDLEAVCAHY